MSPRRGRQRPALCSHCADQPLGVRVCLSVLVAVNVCFCPPVTHDLRDLARVGWSAAALPWPVSPSPALPRKHKTFSPSCPPIYILSLCGPVLCS